MSPGGSIPVARVDHDSTRTHGQENSAHSSTASEIGLEATDRPEPDRLPTLSVRASTASEKFRSQREGTPFNLHSVGSASETRSSARLEGISLMKVVGAEIVCAETYLRDEEEFAPAIPEDSIEEWLDSAKSNEVYGPQWLKLQADEVALHTAVWKLPGQPKHEKDLYPLFLAIFKEVLDAFVKPSLSAGVEREVHCTNATELKHKDGKHYTSPDLVVSATGPFFEIPLNGGSVGYPNIIIFIDVKLDSKLTLKANLRQMLIYARQVFAHQPNRLFVRGIVVSERRFQLVHFDRSGVQVSPYFNLNDNPHTFIRVIIELCGSSDLRAGFDDSLHWTIVDGKKSAGTMKFGEPGQETNYVLLDSQPLSHSFGIRGRASTIWAVCESMSDEVFIVKDSWISDGRTPEHELLLKVRQNNIVGVAEIVDHHVRDIQTVDFRCKTTADRVVNRRAMRIVMKPHGREIQTFMCPLEVLRALHDATYAHFGLYGLNILHRDISNRNVLLGIDGAEVGWRGVLIDLGVALDFGEDKESAVRFKEARSGTRFFQSCMILKVLANRTGGRAPPHDHLDDLEGIFLLTCFLMLQYHPDGTEREAKDEAREIVKGWESEQAAVSLDSKMALFNPTSGNKEKAIGIVSKTWGSACATLFKSYLEWVAGIHERKSEILSAHEEGKTEIGECEDLDAIPEEEDMAEVEELGEESIHAHPEAGCSHVDSDDDDIFAPTFVEQQVNLGEGIFAPLMGNAAEHYKEVLGFFDRAITALEQSPETAGPLPVPDLPAPPPLVPNRKRSKRKRSADVIPESSGSKNTAKATRVTTRSMKKAENLQPSAAKSRKGVGNVVRAK